jgi:predicted RNA-binding Zn-ribbon protein involved in translation (DUF1610 family)
MRTTIEAKHLEKLQISKSTQEEIEYLLDVAKILESYGEENSNIDIENRTENYFNKFVEVVSRNSDGLLYDKYVNIIDNKPIESNLVQINSYICKKCNVDKHVLDTDAHLVCPNCGESDIYFDSGTQGMSYEQEINSEINTSFAYKRINHFNEWLAQFQAKEMTQIPQDLVDEVKEEFRKSRIRSKDITQHKVKQYLKKLGYNKFYEHSAQITNILNNAKPPNMPLHLEEQMRNMFRIIQEPFEIHKPKSRSNFLSYSYCLYKFCELLGEDEYLICFPLLKSREKLHQQDVIWKKITNQLNWQFIPTV